MKRLAVALVAVLALSACGAESPSGPNDTQDTDTTEISRVKIDGVNCIVINEYNRAALSCDWDLTTPTP